MSDKAFYRFFIIVLFVVLILEECDGQIRRGTISVDGTSYSVYTAPDSYGGTHLSLSSDAHALTASQVSVEIPIVYEQGSTYWGPDTDHFIDSLKITTRATTLWMLHVNTSKYKSVNDPVYRKMIIGFCKDDGTIPKDYIE